MWNSNKILWVVLGCAGVSSGLLSADMLTLSGERTKLSGTVRGINEAGVVELVSNLSPSPLMVKGEAVESINFGDKPVLAKPPTAVIELVNDDLLPVTIESLDEKQLTVTSPEAGRLLIPRDCLKSMQLGILNHKIYAGPQTPEEWTSPEKSARWTFDQNGFTTRVSAIASKKFALPQQFVLSFTLKWEARQVPNFAIYFADPLGPVGTPSDRYFLQFGGAGLEIKREATKVKHYNTLLLLNRTPNQYPNNQLQVEIRVDRRNSRIKLLLNGEPEGEIADPIPGAPAGSGITLVCNASDGGSQEIRNIEIFDNDNFQGRRSMESSGVRKNDSLTSNEDDRWTGRLVGIRGANAGPVFSFKNEFQKEPLEISGADVSSVWFATRPDAEASFKPASFVLRLRGDGSLHLSSILLGADAATVVHPLLGTVKLLREGILSLEKIPAKTETVK